MGARIECGRRACARCSRLSKEKEIYLLASGVIVKSYLDPCSMCDPVLEQKKQLELARMDLENRLLKKRIDLRRSRKSIAIVRAKRKRRRLTNRRLEKILSVCIAYYGRST